jgi:glycosyltransferase involved in cell wall biosynthesis
MEYAEGSIPAAENFKAVYPYDVKYMSKPGVSIVICCHNGARRLSETIRHIAYQVVPQHVQWEFILVDNCSTDDSAALAEDEWALYKTGVPLRVVPESRLGLSFARERGFAAARYEYVILCDDDNWLAEDFVALSYEIMSSNSRIGALGGFGKLAYEIEPPGYIEFCNIFAGGEQAPFNGPVPSHKLYGAGCIVRKSAVIKLKELGFKTLLTDRKGNDLSSGGDYELCFALAILGYEIWYDDRLHFVHFITRERLTWDYFMRYAKESAACFDILSSYSSIADNPVVNRYPFIFITRNFFYFLRRFIRMNLKRLVNSSESDYGKMLYFRHTVLKHKLKAYLERFGFMLRVHRQIIKFREQCSAAYPQEVIEVSSKRSWLPFELTSASKPYRQL